MSPGMAWETLQDVSLGVIFFLYIWFISVVRVSSKQIQTEILYFSSVFCCALGHFSQSQKKKKKKKKKKKNQKTTTWINYLLYFHVYIV